MPMCGYLLGWVTFEKSDSANIYQGSGWVDQVTFTGQLQQTSSVAAIQVTPPLNGSLDCPATAVIGEQATCTATADQHYTVADWSGACAGQSGSSCTFTVSDSNTVGVVFVQSLQTSWIFYDGFEADAGN